jgi:hypothetical protein
VEKKFGLGKEGYVDISKLGENSKLVQNKPERRIIV